VAGRLPTRTNRQLSPDEVYPAGDSRARVRFIMARGLRIRTVEMGPPDGPPVVCVPGWASSAFQYRKNLPLLAAAGFRAIAVELGGQGESERPTDGAFYTVRSLADNLRGILDALSLRRVSLVGQSLGGAIVSTAAAADLSRVEKLALIAPVGLARVRGLAIAKLLMPHFLRPILPRLAWRLWWDIGLRMAYGRRGRPTPDDVDQYWAPSRDPLYVPSLQTLLHQVEWEPLEERRVGQLHLPVLVVAASADPLLGLDEVKKAATWLPNGRLVVIEGAGHAVQEEVPDEVNRALVAFLQG
jgi:pimeloyl-ACP methyl ester carboxylesterase